MKGAAIAMRKRGASFKRIEMRFGIPRSTLSGWLKPIRLNKKQKAILLSNWKKALVSSRAIAVAWHNQQKSNRLKSAESEAQAVIKKMDSQDPILLDLALSMLYMGEGFKTNVTGMGNSDPMVLKFFIAVLSKNYNIPIKKFKCELHLRADQDPRKTRQWWSKQLKIPLSNFTSASIDRRTVGSTTYPTYKGVCIVRCGSIAIQRKLMYLSKIFCQKVIEEWALSSVVERVFDVNEVEGPIPSAPTKNHYDQRKNTTRRY